MEQLTLSAEDTEFLKKYFESSEDFTQYLEYVFSEMVKADSHKANDPKVATGCNMYGVTHFFTDAASKDEDKAVKEAFTDAKTMDYIPTLFGNDPYPDKDNIVKVMRGLFIRGLEAPATTPAAEEEKKKVADTCVTGRKETSLSEPAAAVPATKNHATVLGENPDLGVPQRKPAEGELTEEEEKVFRAVVSEDVAKADRIDAAGKSEEGKKGAESILLLGADEGKANNPFDDSQPVVSQEESRAGAVRDSKEPKHMREKFGRADVEDSKSHESGCAFDTLTANNVRHVDVNSVGSEKRLDQGAQKHNMRPQAASKMGPCGTVEQHLQKKPQNAGDNGSDIEML